MVNAWTWGLLGGIAVAVALTFLLALALRRRPRTVGLGALLVPVTGLWLWAFGVTAEDQDTVTRRTFSVMVAVGDGVTRVFGPGGPGQVRVPVTVVNPSTMVIPAGRLIALYPAGQPMSIVTATTGSPAAAFWQAMCILGVMALVAVVASRQAGYLAAAGLVAFGLYQLVAVAVFTPDGSGTAWYDWLYGMTSRGTVGGIAAGSVVAGLVLGRYTVIRDMLERMAARREVPGLPVLLLSAHVEQLYARELLADQAGAVGYLLKDRVFNDDQFTDAVRAVASGGTVMDPEVVAKLLGRRARDEPVARLSAREREVLALMAEGRSNSAIAQRLCVSDKAVGKHCTSIFAKLDLAPSDDDNRRVLAVLAYLNA